MASWNVARRWLLHKSMQPMVASNCRTVFSWCDNHGMNRGSAAGAGGVSSMIFSNMSMTAPLRSLEMSPANYFSSSASSSSALSQELKSKLDEIVKKDKVIVFMKGVPDAPRCGFSNAVSQILKMHGVTYQSYDVLSDESLRQGVKEYSKWPTIPQVYVDGVFVGGCDILLQMHRTGELIDTLKDAGITSTLKEEFKPDNTNKCSK